MKQTPTVSGSILPALLDKTVTSPDVLPAAKEQYFKLATTLHHAQAERGARTLLVTSAVAGEGKSLTSTNLALTLSHSFKRRVLLVDADVRRPSQHHAFQIPLSPGLCEALKPGAEATVAPVAVSSMLSLLPAGTTQDAMGVMTSGNFGRVLECVGEGYDWILIDTPPVGLLSDAKLVSAFADAVVLVVLAGRTPLSLITNAAETLGRERILGVVLNRAESTAVMGGYYHNYGNYYGPRKG